MKERTVILDRTEALRRAGNLSKSTERRIAAADPTFPKPVRISPRRIGYYEHEWEQWLKHRSRAERGDV